MSTSLTVKAFASKENKEFKKHFAAVKFCIENELSYPKETSEFFNGKVNGSDNLEHYSARSILEQIKNGLELPLKMKSQHGDEIRIKVSDIPKEADELVITLS